MRTTALLVASLMHAGALAAQASELGAAWRAAESAAARPSGTGLAADSQAGSSLQLAQAGDAQVDLTDPVGAPSEELAANAAQTDDEAIGEPAAADADAEDPAGSEQEITQGAAASPLQVLGEGSMVLYLVDHSPVWSMHADNVPADMIFRLWQGVGGPEVRTKTLIDHPFSMAVHRLSAERIVARLLDGFNYTLQYQNGRLASVNVLSPTPTRMYKTPRLVEARGKWTDTELDLLDVTDQAPAPASQVELEPVAQPLPPAQAKPAPPAKIKPAPAADGTPAPKQRLPYRGGRAD